MTKNPLPIRREGVRVNLNSAPTSLPEGVKLRMLGDQMLVEVLPWAPSEELVVQYHGRALRGVVKAVGPGCHPWRYSPTRDRRWRSKAFRPCDVKVGDIVELGGLEMAGYPFQELLIGNALHVVVREEDICIVVSES